MTYEAAEGWTTLADPTRRSILMELAGGERTVNELTQTLPISQPAVSQHLKVLKHVGLVSDRPAGTRRIYRLNEAGVVALRDQLDLFWKRAMSGFEHLMEEEDRRKRVPVGEGAGLRATGPAGLQLGHQPDLAARGP